MFFGQLLGKLRLGTHCTQFKMTGNASPPKAGQRPPDLEQPVTAASPEEAPGKLRARTGRRRINASFDMNYIGKREKSSNFDSNMPETP